MIKRVSTPLIRPPAPIGELGALIITARARFQAEFERLAPSLIPHHLRNAFERMEKRIKEEASQRLENEILRDKSVLQISRYPENVADSSLRSWIRQEGKMRQRQIKAVYPVYVNIINVQEVPPNKIRKASDLQEIVNKIIHLVDHRMFPGATVLLENKALTIQAITPDGDLILKEKNLTISPLNCTVEKSAPTPELYLKTKKRLPKGRSVVFPQDELGDSHKDLLFIENYLLSAGVRPAQCIFRGYSKTHISTVFKHGTDNPKRDFIWAYPWDQLLDDSSGALEYAMDYDTGGALAVYDASLVREDVAEGDLRFKPIEGTSFKGALLVVFEISGLPDPTNK